MVTQLAYTFRGVLGRNMVVINFEVDSEGF